MIFDNKKYIRLIYIKKIDKTRILLVYEYLYNNYENIKENYGKHRKQKFAGRTNSN